MLTYPMIHSSDIIGLGLHRLNQTQEPGSQMIKPNISVLYPQYNTSNKYVHDLMLIKLSEPAVISGTVKPIRMSSECPDFGTSCLLSGWVALSQGSHPDILECVDTVVFSPGILREVYTFTRFYKMFFAYSDRYNGSFYREYGGPLVCNGELQGIHVAGSLHNLYKLDLHINICRYKNWIEKIMKTY
ncbi:kallikrein-4-like [Ctenodactylus gundi]